MDDCDPSALPLPPDTDDDIAMTEDDAMEDDDGEAGAGPSAGASVGERLQLKGPEEALAYWNASLEKGSLSCHHFREWWRREVPKLLSPTSTMDYKAPQSHIDDEEVKRQLLRPLEQFIFSGDPVQEMERLSKLEDPPAQCCKLFRMGEPTYSCRDCGHDPTCVLCVDCFKRSEHRHHRYKMSTSCGGGYCDCGDVEAFSQFPHCDFHGSAAAAAGGGGGSGKQAADPLRNVPQDIQDRTKHVFASVMRYAYDMLTTDSMINLKGDLTFKVHYAIVAPFPRMNLQSLIYF